MPDITLELRLARTMLGPLSRDLKRKINNLITNPCDGTWEEAHAIILTHNPLMTLWQAVVAIDPTFPLSKTGDLWDRIPDPDLVKRALVHTTH